MLNVQTGILVRWETAIHIVLYHKIGGSKQQEEKYSRMLEKLYQWAAVTKERKL